MPAFLLPWNIRPSLPQRRLYGKTCLRATSFRLGRVLVLCRVFTFCMCANAQQPLTWDNVVGRFEANNPTLLADRLNIDESKAQEITAYLRPNPQFTLSTDG